MIPLGKDTQVYPNSVYVTAELPSFSQLLRITCVITAYYVTHINV